MANGDLLVQLLVPPKPAASQYTDAQYLDAVTAQVDTRLTTIGLSAVMPSWKNRTDLPSSESGSPAFVEARLSAAGITTADYNFTLANAGENPVRTRYCVLENGIQCYATVSVTPKSPLTPNDFELTVQLDAPNKVEVAIRFVPRPSFPFPT